MQPREKREKESETKAWKRNGEKKYACVYLCGAARGWETLSRPDPRYSLLLYVCIIFVRTRVCVCVAPCARKSRALFTVDPPYRNFSHSNAFSTSFAFPPPSIYISPRTFYIIHSSGRERIRVSLRRIGSLIDSGVWYKRSSRCIKWDEIYNTEEKWIIGTFLFTNYRLLNMIHFTYLC